MLSRVKQPLEILGFEGVITVPQPRLADNLESFFQVNILRNKIYPVQGFDVLPRRAWSAFRAASETAGESLNRTGTTPLRMSLSSISVLRSHIAKRITGTLSLCKQIFVKTGSLIYFTFKFSSSIRVVSFTGKK